MTGTTQLETPVFFKASGADIFGVFTQPDGTSNGLAALTLSGGGPFPTPGKNQVRVRLARQLAGLGYHVLRIDYHGIGDSEDHEGTTSNVCTEDALGAVRWLQEQGFDRILLVGVCIGARAALGVLPAVPQVVGTVLAAPPVGLTNHRETIIAQPWSWYLKRAISPGAARLILGSHGTARRRRATLKARARRAVTGRRGADDLLERAQASPEFLESMSAVLQSSAPMLLLYGRRDDYFGEFERSMNGRLGRLIDGAPGVTVKITDEAVANLAGIEAQDTFLRECTSFAQTVASMHDSATPE